jgi:hypothetical protein
MAVKMHIVAIQYVDDKPVSILAPFSLHRILVPLEQPGKELCEEVFLKNARQTYRLLFPWHAPANGRPKKNEQIFEALKIYKQQFWQGTPRWCTEQQWARRSMSMIKRRFEEITEGRVAKGVKGIMDLKLRDALIRANGDAQKRHAEKMWRVSERTVRTYLKVHNLQVFFLT